MAAVIPWLFSWSGMILALVGVYLFGGIGINLCCHRLLTHRSFSCPRWFERLLTLVAFCNLEGSSVRWVAIHRMHHRFSDHRPDPHSPLVDFLWGHLVWMFVQHPDVCEETSLEHYTADLRKDPFHGWMHRNYRWLAVWAIHALIITGIGATIGATTTGDTAGALQMGLSWLIWGVMVRMVLVWHITWSINSITHLWGYQSYRSTDQSRNNWLLGFLAFGEGWHNNHHADQRSASNWHHWWEVDLTYMVIRFLGLLGLAKNIVRPQRYTGTDHDLIHKTKHASE